MTVGSRVCDLRVQLGRQPTAPVELDRGLGGGDETARAPTGAVGANFSILAETLLQRGNRVVTNNAASDSYFW
jgi:hypothetical protein